MDTFWEQFNTGENDAMNVILHLLIGRNTLDWRNSDFSKGFNQHRDQNSPELGYQLVVKHMFGVTSQDVLGNDAEIVHKIAG